MSYNDYVKSNVKRKYVERRIARMANSVCAPKKVTLKQGLSWMSDIKNNEIEYVLDGPLGILQLSPIEFLGTTYHEAAHLNYTGEIKFHDKKNKHLTKEFFNFINAFEDPRIEFKLGLHFPGIKDNFSKLYELMDRVISKEQILNLEEKDNLLVNFIRKIRGYEPYFKSDKVSSFFNKYLEPLLNTVQRFETTEQLVQNLINKKVWESYVTEFIDPPEENDKDENQEGREGGEGEEEKDESENNDSQGSSEKQEGGEEIDDNEETEGQGSNSQDQQDSNDKSNSNQENDTGDIGAKLQQMVAEAKSAMSDEEKAEFDKQYGEALEKTIEANYEEIEKEIGDGKIEDANEFFKSTDLSADKSDVEDFEDKKLDYEDLKEKIKHLIPVFKRRFSSIVEDNNYRRFGSPNKSGKLNSKFLYKFEHDSDRLFSKRTVRQNKDYNICILMDESGSMFGEKAYQSILALVLICEVLKDINGVKFQISGFNESFRHYKSFNETFSSNIKRKIEFINSQVRGRDSGNTNDAIALDVVRNNFKHVEGKKILFVFSDGDSNPSRDLVGKIFSTYKKNPSQFSVKKEEEMNDKQKIISYGIGLKYSGVKNFYKNPIVINNVSELPEKLMVLLKKHIKRF